MTPINFARLRDEQLLREPSNRLRKAVALGAALALLAIPLAAQAGDRAGDRIAGGSPATAGAYPWMVALVEAKSGVNKRGHFCGGSLIGPTRVLTAAHCVSGLPPHRIDAVVGGFNLAVDDGVRVGVAAIAVHPRSLHNDVAVLELAAPVSPPPIGIVGPGDEPSWAPGVAARVLGWGTLNYRSGRLPDVLQQVDVPIVSVAECAKAYGRDFIESVNIVCAGGELGRDNCYGDSGGPLVVADGAGGYLQAGVVNFSSSCRGAIPGGYARVATLRDFILDPAPVFAPFIEGRPRVSGKRKVGHWLRCERGLVHGHATSKRFRWLQLRGGVEDPIREARNVRYRLRPRDAHRQIGCAFSVANDGGSHGTTSKFVRIRGV